MNIAKILKNCPKGTKLYSPTWGEVELMEITDDEHYAIGTKLPHDTVWWFTNDGRCNYLFNGECMLFPSKDNRDWNTFKVPKKEYEFKPFDKVLVRDYDTDEWVCDIFSHHSVVSETSLEYICVGARWKYCIPYEGNQDLVGTTNEPK